MATDSLTSSSPACDGEQFVALSGLARSRAYCVRHCRNLRLFARAVSTLTGSGEAGYKEAIGNSAQFASPSALAWMSVGGEAGSETVGGGLLVVCDTENHRIRAIELPSGQLFALCRFFSVHLPAPSHPPLPSVCPC
jgi:hypothetical protein